jgi:nucleotide-binding universal stress UspA family protein
MFEKILYPTDFSDVSKKALDYIKQLKDAGTKEVIILHVIDLREIARELDFQKVLERMEEKAREETKTIETELNKNGFYVKSRIETGIPFRDILRVEKEEDISLIVMGSHGKSCIDEMIIGSVSEKVIRKSTKPVLVIRR